MSGDQTDILGRLKAGLPTGWFQAPTPILDSVLSGFAAVLAQAYSLIQFAKLQTRIATATDGFLDLISRDYLGTTLPRNSGEMDGTFRSRIQAAILRQKATRAGMIATLVALTGRVPVIVVPSTPNDVGAYGVSTSGYRVAGYYGSLLLPYQCFITAYRALGSGIPNVAGYGISTAGYGVASQNCYCDLSQVTGSVPDSAIYAAIAATEAEGTICWTEILS